MDSKVRSYLRSQAQTLQSVVMIGKAGHSENIDRAMAEALDCHELVKVKFQCQKDQVRSISESLAETTGSELVSTTGFTAVFYKQNPDPAKRVIRIPNFR